MLTRFLIYGAVGCLMEIFWTGMGSLLQKNYKLTANTSIWMFFIYGMAAFMEPVIQLLQPYPVLIRGVIYAMCIFAVEYVTGMSLKRADLCPWDYSGTRYSIQGVIRLDYAPAWFGAGLVFERVFLMLSQT